MAFHLNLFAHQSLLICEANMFVLLALLLHRNPSSATVLPSDIVYVPPGYPELRLNRLLYAPNLDPAGYTTGHDLPIFLKANRWILLNYTHPECCQEFALLRVIYKEFPVKVQTRIAFRNLTRPCAPKLLFHSVKLVSVVNHTVILDYIGTQLPFKLVASDMAGQAIGDGNCRKAVLMDSHVSGGAVLISYHEVFKSNKEESLVSHLIMVMWIIVLFFWLMHVGNYVWKVYDED